MESLFICNMPNCSMAFDTDEQLSSHKKKHELSLTLTPSAYKNPFILDQTPTPTQFLSPVSLELQDLHSDNPFDVTFRRANSSNHVSSNFLIPESSFIASLPDSEVLNTPSIILPSEPPTPTILKPSFPKKLTLKTSDNQCTENTDSLPFSPNEQTVHSSAPNESIDEAELPSESANFSSIASSLELLSEDDSKVKKEMSPKHVLQTSVITSVGNSAILKSNAVGVPTAVVVTRASINTVSSLSTVVSAVPQQTTKVKVQKAVPTVVQPWNSSVGTYVFNIHLPDGQHFQLPAITNNQPIITAIQPQVAPTSTTGATTKMKLKQVLTQNQKSGHAVRKNNSSKSKEKSSIYILPDSDEQISAPESPNSTAKPGQNGRKRRDTIDDPDEKRMRSLERNRAAATRCRKKKKMWITDLEGKCKELESINQHLQTEVSLLRNEVAQLKTLLYAHKDCPVSLQQKACGQETGKEICTTIRINTSGCEDLQCVPNVTEISSQNSEFLEMELSSVQSNDSSLTSDMSEVSCRER